MLNIDGQTENIPFIPAGWPAPPSVVALVTTRQFGCSTGRYSCFNLADHVDDDPAQVACNRRLLQQSLKLQKPIQWLQQVHGTRIVEAGKSAGLLEADAIYSCEPGIACAVMTADCLPLLICNAEGSEVAAVHAGWRGLSAGVMLNALKRFCSPPIELLVWLGPAIGPQNFEVGKEVREQFLSAASVKQRELISTCFIPRQQRHGFYYADLYQLARQQLKAAGVQKIYGGDFCTYRDVDHFYSYRREGQTGRMASIIYIKPS